MIQTEYTSKEWIETKAKSSKAIFFIPDKKTPTSEAFSAPAGASVSGYRKYFEERKIQLAVCGCKQNPARAGLGVSSDNRPK